MNAMRLRKFPTTEPSETPVECTRLLEPTGPVHWPDLFANDRQVEVEVGCGKGLFLVSAATERPDSNFFGIEMSHKYAQFAADRVARRRLENVRVARADARRVLAEWIAHGSVSAVHVYFPDPWWKRRHKKRRVFTESFVAHVARVLRAGGELHVASDVGEYFALIRGLVQGHRSFVPCDTPGEHVPAHDLDYLTNFERKYRKEGKPIFRAVFRTTDGPRAS